MTDTNELIAALVEAGYEDEAKAVQRKSLAAQVRNIDPDAADRLEGKAPARQPTPEEARQTADAEFLDTLKRTASDGWTSVPGLLEE